MAAVVLLLCAVAYANTLRNGFVYDDNAIVAGNPLIRSLENLPRIFSTGYWGAENTDAGLYRPLVIATYAFDHALWGYRPAGFHAVNIALHALVSVLGYFLLLALLKRPVARRRRRVHLCRPSGPRRSGIRDRGARRDPERGLHPSPPCSSTSDTSNPAGVAA